MAKNLKKFQNYASAKSFQRPCLRGQFFKGGYAKTTLQGLQALGTVFSLGTKPSLKTCPLFPFRTGLASLTNTVFTIKSQVELRGSMDSVITDLKSNVTLVRNELSHFTRDFSHIKPGSQGSILLISILAEKTFIQIFILKYFLDKLSPKIIYII
jgi:hypothetical protein